jgi:hypothetical protein
MSNKGKGIGGSVAYNQIFGLHSFTTSIVFKMPSEGALVSINITAAAASVR